MKIEAMGGQHKSVLLQESGEADGTMWPVGSPGSHAWCESSAGAEAVLVPPSSAFFLGQELCTVPTQGFYHCSGIAIQIDMTAIRKTVRSFVK